MATIQYIYIFMSDQLYIHTCMAAAPPSSMAVLRSGMAPGRQQAVVVGSPSNSCALLTMSFETASPNFLWSTLPACTNSMSTLHTAERCPTEHFCLGNFTFLRTACFDLMRASW